MRFYVLRTSSDSSSSTPPCDSATQDGSKWFIDVNTLEELLCFKDNLQGYEVILTGNPNNRMLEIYDDYRE